MTNEDQNQQPLQPKLTDLVTHRTENAGQLQTGATSVTYQQHLSSDDLANSAVSRMESKIRRQMTEVRNQQTANTKALREAHAAVVKATSDFSRARHKDHGDAELGTLSTLYSASCKIEAPSSPEEGINRDKGTLSLTFHANISIPENREDENDWPHQSHQFSFTRSYSYAHPEDHPDALTEGLTTIRAAERSLASLEEARDDLANRMGTLRTQLNNVPTMMRIAKARLTDRAIAAMDGGDELVAAIEALADESDLLDELQH